MNTLIPSNKLPSVVTAATFAVLAASLTTVCAADPSSVSVRVKVSDLNVSNPSDVNVLYERIRAGARAACSYYWFERDADEARCVHDAIANTVTKINQPALSAVYAVKYKTAVPKTLVSQSR